MKNKVIWIILGLMYGLISFANIVDVYGTNQTDVDKILNKYSKQVGKLEALVFKLAQQSEQNENDKQFFVLYEQKEKLKGVIKKEFNFSFVNFQTIFYPQKKDLYTTIDVVRANQPERLKFSKPTHYPIPGLPKHDLIDKMSEYESSGFKFMMSNGERKISPVCPVYHCTFGFDSPESKPYLTIFNEGVIKEKPFILSTIKQDREPERRGSAILLVGHFKNPHEIIKIMSAYIQDTCEIVRNNALRVMAATMEKAKIYDVNLLPIMELLDSPSVTDRNKALYVLSVAVKSKSNRKLMIKMGGDHMIQILSLKQLNNHDIAYQLLKKLSGKDFGEHNIAGWQQWLAQTHNSLANIKELRY